MGRTPTRLAPDRGAEAETGAQELEAVVERTFASAVELWLQLQPLAEAPVRWAPRGAAPGSPVPSRERLVELVAGLGVPGRWAVVRRPSTRLWAQTMRVPGGWIVEVNGVPGPECYARRVQTMACDEPRDVLTDPRVAADVIWAWLRGQLAAGFELRDL